MTRYTCNVCGGTDEPKKIEMHKLGRTITCGICGTEQVAVRWIETKEVEPGGGRPRLSKKERKKFRAYLHEHGDQFLIDMEKTLRA